MERKEIYDKLKEFKKIWDVRISYGAEQDLVERILILIEKSQKRGKTK